MLLFFLGGAMGLAAWAFPHWRARWWGMGRSVGHWGRRGGRRAQVQLVQGGARGWAASEDALHRARRWWQASRRLVFVTLALLSLPAVLVLLWSHARPRELEGFDDTLASHDTRVAQLLQGEQLVPPPPLPPAVFLTPEVQLERPLIASADRRWEQLDAGFVQRLLTVFQVMKREHGYDMVLLEGLRSPERQALLAAQGSSVTMAGAGQSYHQYGLAADCAFFKDGRLHISEKEPWAMRGYQLFGQVAEQLGLTWGGRWQMMDLGHVEWRRVSIEQARREASRP